MLYPQQFVVRYYLHAYRLSGVRSANAAILVNLQVAERLVVLNDDAVIEETDNFVGVITVAPDNQIVFVECDEAVIVK